MLAIQILQNEFVRTFALLIETRNEHFSRHVTAHTERVFVLSGFPGDQQESISQHSPHHCSRTPDMAFTMMHEPCQLFEPLVSANWRKSPPPHSPPPPPSLSPQNEFLSNLSIESQQFRILVPNICQAFQELILAQLMQYDNHSQPCSP